MIEIYNDFQTDCNCAYFSGYTVKGNIPATATKLEFKKSTEQYFTYLTGTVLRNVLLDVYLLIMFLG